MKFNYLFGHGVPWRIWLYIVFSLFLIMVAGGCGKAEDAASVEKTAAHEDISDEDRGEESESVKDGITKIPVENKKHGTISVSKDKKTIYVHDWVEAGELSDHRTKRAEKIVFCRDAGIIVDWDMEISYNPYLQDAPRVETLAVEEGNPFLYEKDGMLIQRAGARFDEYSETKKETLILCVPGRRGEIRIPEGVQVIMGGAFIGCSHVTSVVLPSSLEEIGDAAFGSMKSCVSIQADEKDKLYYTREGVLYARRSDIPSSSRIYYSAGYEGRSEIPSSSVAAYPAGKPDKIYDVASELISRIDAGAFLGADHLREVYLPFRLEDIGNAAFQQCKNLRKIQVKDKKGISYVEENAFDGCPKLKETVKEE